MGDTVHDVVIVGAGPVGLALGRMLGLEGHDVLVLERWPQPYPMPRAVHFDDEIGRVFQSMGLTGEVQKISEPVPDFYEWRNASGESLVRIDWSGTGPSGWPTASFFSQPQLERTLADAVERMDNVTVLRGAEVVGLEEQADRVQVTFTSTVRKRRVARARFVVGCDGANSFVRERMATTMHDHGFFFDWLIVDVIPHEDAEWSPQNWQLCDPARPTTVVSGGPGRRRWEFMRLPGETREEMSTAEKAWDLLSHWGRTPENTIMERHALYTFAARWADTWNSGRLIIAGDAAHQMPPFAGQGMCSGLRDAANLSWKLNHVLSGRSGLSLLDTYTSERAVHLQHAIAMSVELGKVICVLDGDAAAERDARMIAAGADPAKVLPVTALPVLGSGALSDTSTAVDLRGTQAPQFPATRSGQENLLDDIIGRGVRILVHDATPASQQHPALRAAAGRIGADVFTIGPGGQSDLTDHTGLWTSWFEENEIRGIVIRPDHYIFGAVSELDALPTVLDEYGDLVFTVSSAPPSLV